MNQATNMMNSTQSHRTRPYGKVWKALVGSAGAAALVLGGGAGLGFAPAAMAQTEAVSEASGPALGGHDPVSYFNASGVRKGDASRSATHDGKVYWFSSDANKRSFERDPARYVPALGGGDPVALSRSASAAGDPAFGAVVGGTLFLLESASSRDAFLGDAGNLAKQGGVTLPVRAVGDYNLETKRPAVQGYDVVAYFPEGGGKATKGSRSHSVNYDGVVYHFANAANAERFKSNPTRYEPSHGGWCSYAMSQGSFAEVDPKKFLIEDDRLLLFYNGVFNDTRKKWQKSRDDLLPDADSVWLKNSGEQKRSS